MIRPCCYRAGSILFLRQSVQDDSDLRVEDFSHTTNEGIKMGFLTISFSSRLRYNKAYSKMPFCRTGKE